MCSMRVVVVPLVLGTLGSVSVCLPENLHSYFEYFLQNSYPQVTKERPAR